MDTPEPGIYENVDFDTYLKWDAVNNSRLSLMKVSPLHYHATPPRDQTKAFALGSLCHGVVLEPRDLLQRYAVLPAFEFDEQNQTAAGKQSTSRTTTYYKQKVAQFEAAIGDREIVEQSWLDQAGGIVSAMLADEIGREVFTDVGPVEVSIIWEDTETGLLCKGRIDKIATTKKALIDLKTTRDLAKFSKAIANFGYHRQMAHYQAGWHALTGDWLLPWIAAVDTNQPYYAHARPLSKDAIRSGRAERGRLMRQLAECLESDVWPAPEAPDEWELPEWAQEPVTLTIGGETITA